MVEREHAHADALATRVSESLACLSECFVCFGAFNSDCVTVSVWVQSNQFGIGLLVYSISKLSAPYWIEARVVYVSTCYIPVVFFISCSVDIPFGELPLTVATAL